MCEAIERLVKMLDAVDRLVMMFKAIKIFAKILTPALLYIVDRICCINGV